MTSDGRLRPGNLVDLDHVICSNKAVLDHALQVHLCAGALSCHELGDLLDGSPSDVHKLSVDDEQWFLVKVGGIAMGDHVFYKHHEADQR